MTNNAYSRRGLLIAALLLTAVVLALLLRASIGTSNARATPTPTPSSSYSVLDQPATASDQNNLAVQKFAAEASVKLSPNSARQLRTAGQNRIWLIPGEGVVCIAAEPVSKSDVNLAAVCDTTAAAAAHGVALQFDGSIIGLAPDGASSVEATSSSSDRIITAPVQRNVYSLPVGTYDATITTSSGTRAFGLNK